MQNDEPIDPAAEESPENRDLDPNSEPQPIKAAGSGAGALMALGCLVAGGALFLLCGIGTTATRGANRSSRLQWEERQQELEQADVGQTQDDACQGSRS